MLKKKKKRKDIDDIPEDDIVLKKLVTIWYVQFYC